MKMSDMLHFPEDDQNTMKVICPHCRIPSDRSSLSLFWDEWEACWRCLICGFREYLFHRERSVVER